MKSPTCPSLLTESKFKYADASKTELILGSILAIVGKFVYTMQNSKNNKECTIWQHTHIKKWKKEIQRAWWQGLLSEKCFDSVVVWPLWNVLSQAKLPAKSLGMQSYEIKMECTCTKHEYMHCHYSIYFSRAGSFLYTVF